MLFLLRLIKRISNDLAIIFLDLNVSLNFETGYDINKIWVIFL